MQDFIAALISFFLIEPLQAEIAEKLKAARAPQIILNDVATCAQAARPVIVDPRQERSLVGRIERRASLDRQYKTGGHPG